MVKTNHRKSRLLECGLRVRLTSVGDGVPQGVEYRPPVGACSDAGPASYEGAQPVKIVSISQDFFDLVDGDRELMLKRDRPCIVVVRLRFRGKRRDFAVPLRSNIAPNVPKDQYFALPPRPATRPGCRHGIHYVKMFPITKVYQRRFRTEGSAYYETLQRIIDGNTKRIVSECQAYLDRYEREGGLVSPSTSTAS